ncbi:MAG: hypothetical protein CVV49_06230 [Spirochaetae bacterium HGW-Spirochaetae-5]|nr:MAG: hypothetical protein CVV49_06230 [Spirochaetae bacterium HGW-Spirochaetae-5]
MKLKYIILIIFLISNIVMCNSIKPKPEGNGWNRCITCKGYGYTITESRTDRNRLNDSEERNKYNNAVKFFKDDPRHHEKADSDTQNYNSGYSGKKRNKTTCSTCNGLGWIKD